MTTIDTRPASAVSGWTGLTGLVGLLGWLAIAGWFGITGPSSALVGLACCALPMVAWSVLVEKVHRNVSTGLDWENPSTGGRLDISLTKLAGLWTTWCLIAIFYAVGRWYWDGAYRPAMQLLLAAAPILVILSAPYVIWLDRRMREPRDGAYAFGALLLELAPVDRSLLYEHARQWAVKGFFTAFMIAIVPGNFAQVVSASPVTMLADPVALAQWLIGLMFLIDVSIATVGYILPLRVLDTHIRSANPHSSAWMAALICYPPFILMGEGGPLNYHVGTRDWAFWLSGHPVLLWIVGGLLVGLTGIYAWATVAFGLRFSNLTNRGILTHGPYRWTRHPAYVSKTIFWWVSTMPFFVTTGSLVDMARNTIILAAVTAVYYWRARTEERHLGADPAYRAYSEWMARNAPLPRLTRWLAGRHNAPSRSSV